MGNAKDRILLRRMGVAFVCVCGLSVSYEPKPAFADTDRKIGSAGTSGAKGAADSDGKAGSNGQSVATDVGVAVINTAADNFSAAQGGPGGMGGDGGAAVNTLVGGDAGNGGSGGTANAVAKTYSFNRGLTEKSTASARGGSGGDGGNAGLGPSIGHAGQGGDGGNATSTATSKRDPLRQVNQEVVSLSRGGVGGNGGQGRISGTQVGNGGNGGSARASVSAGEESHTDLLEQHVAYAEALGGDGGMAQADFAVGGAGGAATADSVDRQSTGPASQAFALGGRGGATVATRGGRGGRGGNASASAYQGSPHGTAYSKALGGQGGSQLSPGSGVGFSAGDGGNASAGASAGDFSVPQVNSTYASAVAIGGDAGNVGPGGIAGRGGDAVATILGGGNEARGISGLSSGVAFARGGYSPIPSLAGSAQASVSDVISPRASADTHGGRVLHNEHGAFEPTQSKGYAYGKSMIAKVPDSVETFSGSIALPLDSTVQEIISKAPIAKAILADAHVSTYLDWTRFNLTARPHTFWNTNGAAACSLDIDASDWRGGQLHVAMLDGRPASGTSGIFSISQGTKELIHVQFSNGQDFDERLQDVIFDLGDLDNLLDTNRILHLVMSMSIGVDPGIQSDLLLYTTNVMTLPVPEPSSWFLAAIGATAILFASRRGSRIPVR